MVKSMLMVDSVIFFFVRHSIVLFINLTMNKYILLHTAMKDKTRIFTITIIAIFSITISNEKNKNNYCFF